MTKDVELLWLGDSAMTLQLSDPDPPAVWGLAAALQKRLEAGLMPGAIEVTAAIRSVTVTFDPRRAEPERWIGELPGVAAGDPRQMRAGASHRIPVCFDQDLAPDLDSVCDRLGLTREAFIAEFLATGLSVRMVGFLPGFAYLGDLPEQCRVARLASPRAAVPAGSVAVAGAFCAIYPWRSPGGWSLIGGSPVRVFDASNASSPALLAPGDAVGFDRIDRGEFERLAR